MLTTTACRPALACLLASIEEDRNAITESDGVDLFELKDIKEWLSRRNQSHSLSKL
jgi:hypothetical protein